MKTVSFGGLTVGNDQPLLVIAGPCQLESLDHAQMIAGQMAEACKAAGAQYVFKGSFDKANRQTRYLSNFVSPVAPDEAAYPRAFEYSVVALLIFGGIYLMISMTAAILREQVTG